MAAIQLILYLLLAGISVYSALIWICWSLWPKLPSAHFSSTAVLPTVAIVIVARNEETNIAKLVSDLARQEYPRAQFDILLMNDGSRDQTIEKASDEAGRCGLNLQVLPVDVPADFHGSHKKLAIMQAADFSHADILLLTDADCRVAPGWVSSHVAYYQHFPEAKLVFGSFLFKQKSVFWHGLLNLEALHLSAVSAATNRIGKPTMCSGANLSYRRNLVNELVPYQDNLFVASGDDEFLFHTVNQHFPASTFYNNTPQSLVTTDAPSSFRAFFHQRKRWAGKWKFYKKPWPMILAAVVLAGNLGSLMAWVVFLVTGNLAVLLLILAKWMPEFLLSYRVGRHLDRDNLLLFFLPMEIIYPFYACFFAIASNFGKYHWKGRSYP